ncbi:hypothetical protein V7S43_015822 [Phytophthora oleae]|uniref:Uncharacterized protein n=1 Tax=Phytophthora oleae TaxID=2107226 RepID=A0ABD3F198_9STRA
MSAKGANPDAEAFSRKKAAKPTSKPAKPRGKASALQAATNVASKAKDHSPGSWSPSQQEETLVSCSGDESDGDDAEGKPEAGAPTTEEHHGDKDVESKYPINTSLDREFQGSASGHGGDTTPPVRNLTLAEGHDRARVILAEEKVQYTDSKKHHASQSPCQDLAMSGDFEDIFGPDSEEEGQVEEPREITDDLDE